MKSANIKKRNVRKDSLQEPLIDDETTAGYDLPYGGKVFLARKKKDDSWLMIGLQVKTSTCFHSD
jgi:hypothetical protein